MNFHIKAFDLTNTNKRFLLSSHNRRIQAKIMLQYCAKVMQTNFDEIPGFSWLFEEI